MEPMPRDFYAFADLSSNYLSATKTTDLSENPNLQLNILEVY
jgi:hypothetical protein